MMWLFVLVVSLPVFTSFTAAPVYRAYFSSSRVRVPLFALPESITARLTNIKRSHATLTERLGDPDVLNDPNLLKKIMSDRSESQDLVDSFDDYCALNVEVKEIEEIINDKSSDAEMLEMAKDELVELKVKLEVRICCLLLSEMC